jgi:radical SAM superfamily enzyme YgiQ (UPF0313 family)
MDFLLAGSHYLAHDKVQQSVAYVYPPLGLMSIAAYLNQVQASEVGVLDTSFLGGEQDFERALCAARPRLLGIHTVITTRRQSVNMIGIAHAHGIPVVVGGPDASGSYAWYLEHGADYAVIGEGEETSKELLQYVCRQGKDKVGEPCGIQGLAYRQDGHLLVNAARPLLADLNSLPFPQWDLVDIPRYLELWRKANGYSSLHVLTARGCPFGCTWCSRAVFGRTVRQRSPERVMAEVAELGRRYQPDSLWFADDTFTINRAWVERFCELASAHRPVIPFRCFTRADRVSTEMLSRLKSAGCRLIHLGVESGSQPVLDAMKKGQTVEMIRQATEQINAAGIEVNYFIMFGYPGEKLADIRATETLIARTRPDSIGFSVAYPIPGTEFYSAIQPLLVPNIDELWEKTTEGVQRMFATEFPLSYYRLTIEHINLRNRLTLLPTRQAPLVLRLKMAWLGLARRLMEAAWSVRRTLAGFQSWHGARRSTR